MCVLVCVHKNVCTHTWEGKQRSKERGTSEGHTVCDMKAEGDTLWEKGGAGKRRAGAEGALISTEYNDIWKCSG